MAFFNRAGYILRQSVKKHIKNEMFQMKRCLSDFKVVVGGLACATDDTSLREAFSAYGEVTEARVTIDRETGRSRGFVTFTDHESCVAAIIAMDQWVLHGQTVSVRWEDSTPLNIPEATETEPFSLIIPSVRRSNLVYDRWRSFEYRRQLLGPGMVLFKNYLTLKGQVDIVTMCQKAATGPGGFYKPSNRSGDKLRLHMMCFGRNWDPVTGYEKCYTSDGYEPPPLPFEFSSLVECAIKDAKRHLGGDLPSMCPDICLANFYTLYGRLSLHQDHDESIDSLRRGLPVVLICIGESAEFLYGHSNDENKLDEVLLESGDVLIFGGKSRLIFHGIRRILSNSIPLQLVQETSLKQGSLNLTLKQF